MTTEEHKFNERLIVLENEIKILKETSLNKSNTVLGKEKVKKEKKTRAQTDYNKYVSAYINEQKEKLGDTFNHKVAFGEAAKQWTAKKNEKS